MARRFPPAIVYGGDTSVGLPIIRELGQRGVDVTVLQRRAEGVGRFSKHAMRWELIDWGYENQIAQLERLTRAVSARFILATSEDFVRFLIRARDEGRLSATPLVPSREAFDAAMDKLASATAARDAGLSPPTAWTIQSLSELDAPPPGFAFPAIVKWPEKGEIWPILEAAGLPLIKSAYAGDMAELKGLLVRYAPIGRFPMIQGFAPGAYLGINLLMAGGKAVLAQQELEVAMWPPEQGIDCVVKAVPLSAHAELRAGAERLLANLGYEGPACVEFRWDEASGRATWLEINPRFWGSQPLAYHCGRHFGWWTYSVLGLGETPPPPDARDDIVARFWIPETRRLIGILMNNPEGGYWTPAAPRPNPLREAVEYVARYVSPKTRYYIWSFEDPGPFIGDMAQAARKAARLAADKLGLNGD
ncbi:MAG: hypothetical protein GC152_13615 [Alphaproteobacteria bacterium]|nr:hypothetical protein [Alphaproteobacteria bacterium]